MLPRLPVSFAQLSLFVLFLSVSATHSVAQAQSGAKPDTSKQALVFEHLNYTVHFENDGSGSREVTAVIRVQSQAAVEGLGQLIFGYSSATENLRIDYVRVRKPDGSIVNTPSSTTQDFAPEILRSAPMYSDYRQRHVSVVALQSGDILEYHVATEVKPLAPGQFWYEHLFPKQDTVQDGTLDIDVPKSREVKLKSPKYKYVVREANDRRIYHWSIQNSPENKNEPKGEDDELDDPQVTPDVQLSTFVDWAQVAHWYAKLQGERVVTDEALRKKADALTQGASSPQEKARRLYNYVALNIRYVSLSFGVGRLQPHAASEVLQNGYGDCKDKHTLLQALLRAEGIKSFPALIGISRKLDAEIPSPAQFDHVITAVQLDKSGKLTWLDSTTEVAPFGLILYQLRNKQALVASDDGDAGLQRTSAESPIKNLVSLQIDGKFTETGALDGKVELSVQGDSDIPMRAALRRVAQADFPRVLQLMSNAWGMRGEVSDVHLDPIEDTTKPLRITYRLHSDDYFHIPNSGTSFAVLPVMARRSVPSVKGKAAEPLDVGPAEERVYNARIQIPANYTLHLPSNLQIVRDWGEYRSSYTLRNGVLEAERRTVLRVNELPPSRRSDYESFQTVANSLVEQGLWCSISAARATVAAVNKPTQSADELRRAGTAALDRMDFATAADLLKQAVDQDATQKNAWENLGRAYAGLNQHDEAVKAFRKQIELDPDHARVNLDIASELQQQNKLQEAVDAYKRQIEITPSNKLAHKGLGLLFAEMKQDRDARTELETAASLPPDDPLVQIALARVYSRTGDKDKAGAMLKTILGSGSLPEGGDLFSAALRDDVDPAEQIRDARDSLNSLGDQFDSGEYDRFSSSTSAVMGLIALEWARIGWASFAQGRVLDSIQYLNAAWLLSQSGAIANRLARSYEKENQREKARHMFALAAAAGGSDADASREQLSRLAENPEFISKEMADAQRELIAMRTIKLHGPGTATSSAHFGLVFDNSPQPDRIVFLGGDVELRSAAEQLKRQEFDLRFPDVSSIKIVREATLSCEPSACSLTLVPLAGP